MLGARSAVLRRSAGMSQTDMAKQLGISTSAVGMYEQGRREPSVDMLIRIAQLFDVTTDFLLTGQSRTDSEKSMVDRAIAMTLLDADNRLQKRDRRPFTREELTVLFAAMLLDT